MTTIRKENFSYGIVCPMCNDLLIAPYWSAYVSEYEVRHFWCCENCGHPVDTHVLASSSELLQDDFGIAKAG